MPHHGYTMEQPWNWSWRVCRLAGVEVRIHWTLVVLAVFQALGAVGHANAWWWLPVLLVIPVVSILLHEFGHVFMARRCGGGADEIVMWAMGGLAMCWVPPKALKHFLTAAAGPLVNLVICGAACAIIGLWPWQLGDFGYASLGTLGLILGFTAAWNLSNFLFNLIPCYPLDGGRMLRAALWPVVGRRRAVFWTIYLAYVILTVGAILAALWSNLLLFVMAVLGLVMAYREHVAARQGVDPYLGEFPEAWQRESTRFSRWRIRRAEQAEARAAAELANEQATLDRLLDKVSEHGLPSLTAGERRELERISKRQKARAANG